MMIRYMLGRPLCAAAILAALAMPQGALAQSPDEQAYQLPALDLAEALRTVAARSGKNLVVSSELLAGRYAPPLNGRYTPIEAVRALLSGSGLAASEVGDALVVTSASRVASPGIPTDPSTAAPGDESETIVVTGTHLRGAEPTSPLLTLTRRDIDRTGATSVEDLMRTVPQNLQGGVNKENFGAILPDQDVTDHGAGINLRGLGQRATLVLVNGRRLAPSGFGAFVDVSLIPITAVERVDILTDGASAIYGSDAVGGVVNFILREDFAGMESNVQAGKTTRGGGEQLQLSHLAGKSWASGNAMLAYEYRREDEIRAGDRSFTVNLRPDTFILPRERKHSLFGALRQELGAPLRFDATGSFTRRDTERSYFQSVSPLQIDADARAEAVSVAGMLTYELPSDWRARLEGNYALSDTKQQQIQIGGNPLVNARDVRNAILEFGLKLDGGLFALPGGTARLALGAQARSEAYRDAFSSSMIAETVAEAERSVRSLFGEIALPIVSEHNALPGLRRLHISAAARYDRYGRTGSTLDPKIGILLSPVRNLDLRASYSTSFRAPLLSEITGAYTVIFLPAQFVYADPGDAPAGAIAAVLQGSNPDVRPETSRTWTAGGDFRPAFAPGLTLTANYYAIRFSDRIALPTRIINVVGNPAFEPIIDRNPDVAALTRIVEGAQLILDGTGPGFSNGNATPADVSIVLDDRISNTALTTTRGFDVGIRYAFTRGNDHFVLDANLNHVIAFDDQLTTASPIVNALDRVYRPLNWRGRAGFGWNRAGWSGSLFVNHADGYLDDRAPARRRVAAHTTIDAALSYIFSAEDASWLAGTRIAIFAENLFDAAPPRLLPDPGMSSGLGYDPVNASGRGRFLALQLRRRW